MAEKDPSPQLDYQNPKTPRTWRDDVSAEWSRFISGFTRDNVVGHLKTLAWVVPLTLLIWIYAEREQVATMKDVAVPFKIAAPDTRVVNVKLPQDMNLILELQGPQARLQEVLNELRGGKGTPRGLDIELPASWEVNRDHRPDTLPLIRDHKTFVNNGVTVLSVQPAKLEIGIDEVVEREARIIKPPALKNLEATFDPPTVKVRGPRSVLNRAADADPANPGRLTVTADLSDELSRRNPGRYPDITNFGLIRLGELADDTITITAPPGIRANVEVREANKSLVLSSMVVSLDVPEGLLDKYKVTDFRPVLQNVTITGPPTIIDAIERNEFDPKPKARVVVTQQDVGDRHSIKVQYDLPKGVEVSPEDQKREVEIHLVDRATLGP